MIGALAQILSLVVSSSTEAGIMAEIHKLSVEKTLNKIRGDDAKQSKEAAFKARWMCSMRK